jgi:hypothetical protein
MFRDGRRSINPAMSMKLSIPVSEWGKLRTVLAQFGRAHGMAVQDYSTSDHSSYDGLSVSLCNDEGTNIEINSLHFSGADETNLYFVPIGIYLVRDNKNWKNVARDLAATLNGSWPGEVTFAGPRGEKVPPPLFLSRNAK